MNHGNISYTPVPCICKGIITSIISETNTFEVQVYHSPLGEMMSPVYASLIYQPGQIDNFKKGSLVRIMVTFIFGGTENKFIDLYPNSENYILGIFDEDSIVNLKVDNPLTSAQDDDRVRFINRNSGSGIVATNSGKVIMAGGAIYHQLNPFGSGIHENSSRLMAQNHQRMIAYNSPLYLSREFFGMYGGIDDSDRSSRMSPEDYLINFRRFVTQTKSPNNWVSTCEGTWAPWVGANNDFAQIEPSRNVLFTKIINCDKSRVTIEAGEPGDAFINIRIDDIIYDEKNIPMAPGATPAVVGNRFKLAVSDRGDIEVSASGSATPNENINKFSFKLDSDGNLTILSKGKITLSHGDEDKNNNSIVLDPKDGIDITAKNGMRFNGKELVLKALVDWIDQNKAQLCQTTAPGAPAPIHPLALAGFTSGNTSMSEQGGFLTKNIDSPAVGIIKTPDSHQSV